MNKNCTWGSKFLSEWKKWILNCERKHDESEFIICTSIAHLWKTKEKYESRESFKQHKSLPVVYDGNPRDLLDVLYYTGKPYRPRSLRAQWEYKHRVLRTITGHRVARRARPLRGWLTSSRRRRIVRAGARFNALRNTNQTPHFDCSRVYQTPMEMLLYEPLLMPGSRGDVGLRAARDM